MRSVYVHWPYCKKYHLNNSSKCTYCAFNKYTIPKAGQRHDEMTLALLAELKSALKGTDISESINNSTSNNRIHSVYFGGGTPSLALPSTIQKVIETIENNAILDDNCEITLEMNPSSLNLISEFQKARVNRISLGVQSLNDKYLQLLNRDHSAQEALESLEKVMKTVSKHSVDLIWGLPWQTVSEWSQELQFILSNFRPMHLSLYQLTLEKGTKLFTQVQNGLVKMHDSSTLEEFSSVTTEITKRFRYNQYEISSFVLESNKEAASVHNQSYWNGNDYFGIGPGAHARVGNKRIVRIPDPNRWMLSCLSKGHGTAKITELSIDEIARELIVVGLRKASGISLKKFNETIKKDLKNVKLN